MRYSELTSEQIQEICNGCGGKGGIITPPHSAVFKEECNHHDFNYFLGYSEEHRKKADTQLMYAMLLKCKSLSWLQRLRYTPWCLVYYIAVRAVGWKFFYYGSSEQEVPFTN